MKIKCKRCKIEQTVEIVCHACRSKQIEPVTDGTEAMGGCFCMAVVLVPVIIIAFLLGLLLG